MSSNEAKTSEHDQSPGGVSSGAVTDYKKDPSETQYDDAVISIAYSYLDIVRCVCGYPRVRNFVCGNCKYGSI